MKHTFCGKDGIVHVPTSRAPGRRRLCGTLSSALVALFALASLSGCRTTSATTDSGTTRQEDATDTQGGSDYELDDVMALYADSIEDAKGEISAEVATVVLTYKLSHLLDWPAGSFARSDGRFVVCLATTNPLRSAAEKIFTGRARKGREIVLKNPPGTAEWAGCHVAFLGPDELESLDDIVAATDGLTLTVSSGPELAERGLMLEFGIENNKLKLKTNAEALKAGSFNVDPRLLELGRQ